MAPELSSNWKKLQAQIKAESTTTSSSAPKTTTKRKADDGSSSHSHPHPKRQKLQNPSKQPKQQSSSKTPNKPSPNPPTKPPMGITQSSALARGTPATITPSLALWAEDNDISAEDLAEAYSLGVKHNASLTAASPARVNEGLAPGVEVGKYIAVDCEMVGVGPEGRESVLARVSIVDFHGRQVYDSFVAPRERVTDYRTRITGLTPRVLASARSFDEVQAAVAELLKGRIVVGHDIKHDLAALQLAHPSSQVRDTAKFAGYRKYGHGPKPALRVLAREVLGVEIQTGHHSSIEDARVAMLLFRKKKSDFDVQHASRYGLPVEKTIASEKVAGDSRNGGGGKAQVKAKKSQGKKKKKKH